MWCVYHTSVKSKDFYKNKPKRVFGIVLRALIHIVAILLNTIGFWYASLAHINQGIIAGLLSSNIMFTSILFRIFYGEKIRVVNWVSMAMIISGVLCVSIKDEDTDQEIVYNYVLLAVAVALSTGFTFAFSAAVMKHFLKDQGFTPARFNIDGSMISGCIMLVGLIYTHRSNAYTAFDILEGVLTSFLLMGGIICIGSALNSGGKGGPIQSIDSLKSLIPLGLYCLI
jgi:drug/metabolite transporter (DMT)-like permease